MNESEINLNQQGKGGAKLTAAVLLGVLVVFCLCGGLRFGVGGMKVAAVAVATCGFALVAGRVVEQFLHGPEMAHYRFLGGVLPRMIIPLLTCAMIYRDGRGALVDAGFVYYLLPVYFIVLGLETWLSLVQAQVDPVSHR